MGDNRRACASRQVLGFVGRLGESHGLGLVLLLAAVSCGPTSSRPESHGSRSFELSAAAKAGCANGVFLEDHHTFRYIGAAVTSRLCSPVGLEAPTIVTTDDATGAPVDFGSLLEADAVAFHSGYASLEPEFRAKLEAEKVVAQEAYVWFYVDESDSPDKEWLVNDAVVANAAEAVRESRMRAAAAGLAAKLTGAGAEITSNITPSEKYGIPVVRVRATFDVFDAVGTWPEVWRIDRAPALEELKPQAETYYYTTLESYIDGVLGYDGTGVTVAIWEHFVPDSWQNLPGAPAGSCADWSNPPLNKKCHCPYTGGTALERAHPRATMGILRRSLGTQGMANDATTIMADDAGGCSAYGNDPVTSAVNWSTANGASVISFSVGNSTGGDISATDMFMDYKAFTYPCPLIATSSGNDDAVNVCNKNRNGLTVGGGVESQGTLDRSLVTMDTTSYKNGTGSYDGQEKPNLVAISKNVTTAGIAPDTTDVTGGSSASTPEVAGIVASLHEANPNIRSWPEVMVPGMMVSANEDVDNTILNLNDTVDDKDGAGLVNAFDAWKVLASTSKVHNTGTPFRSGHDYHPISSSSTPGGTFYSEVWHALVPAGVQVRAEAFLQTRPTCPTNPDVTNCTADPYPYFGLFIYDGATLVRASLSANNNYQYAAFTNTSGVQKDYTIKIYLGVWNGLTSTTFGVAWDSL